MEGKIDGVHTYIKKMELEKELMVRRLSEFGESISLRISSIERQFEECAKEKDTYANITYSNLNAIRSKVKPFLFMGGENNVIRSETIAIINQMMGELNTNHSTIEETLEVSVIGDTMHVD